MTGPLVSLDPATGEVVWQGAAASAGEVHTAVEQARAALPDWSHAPLEDRIAMARAYRGVLENRKDQLAELIARETGKALWDARGEVAATIGKIELSIAAHAERAGERHAAQPFGEAVLRHRPHGVMAVLGPFNFPGHLPNGHIVPALIAGNTVVFKPSELTPAVGEAMLAAWREAGLPRGVLEIVQGGRETGAALVEAEIDGLLFTGSAAAGAHFRRLFADRPNVILALELGGNNPLVAWDGDVEEVAAIVLQSAFMTTGQRCSCARRLIVPEGAFGETLVHAVAGLAPGLRVGAWNELPEAWMGPLVSAHAAEQAMAQAARLAALGARTIRPLGAIEGRNPAFVTPAIFDITGIAAPDEEIFAPVLQVQRVATYDDALIAANATRFGLAAGLVSEDDALWRRFVHENRAGVVNRNRPTTGASGAMPFGGSGASGNHRPSGYYAADYCAWPVASFEAATAAGNRAALDGVLQR